ncbi:MAG: AbrB/MazE/SpoVT family DNA-binding domain-containing protein [Elusimicrobia bacterium]|nr:AbrB/MazE/SpoVT family DNA-binding domain-containing protein [Elusimicrobiota bacterium]
MNQPITMSTVTVKGQVVIPAKLRRKVGLKKGTRVYMEEHNGDIIIHPATPEFYDRACGILKGAKLTEALQALRQEDKQREERRFEKR